MTDYLEKRIGTIVSCLYVEDGKMKGVKGILTNADDQRIEIDDKPFSFVDDNFAIYAIFIGEKTILYKNEIALAMCNLMVSSYSAPAEATEVTPEAVTDVPVAPAAEERPSTEELDAMFKKLVDSIGTPVHIEYMFNGEETRMIGVLNSVLSYDLVTVNSHPIPFIGPYTGVVEIMTLNGKPLYYNGKAKTYTGCKNEDTFALINAQEEHLGKSIAREGFMNKPRS